MQSLGERGAFAKRELQRLCLQLFEFGFHGSGLSNSDFLSNQMCRETVRQSTLLRACDSFLTPVPLPQ
jgi:hypothetical protein